MEKIFNWISIVAAAVGGFFVRILGGWDAMLITLVSLVILDYITGWLKAIYNKELSSEIGFKGIIKKILIFVVVIACNVLQSSIGADVPLREIAIVFYISNEALSLVENVGEIIPLPEKVKNVLLQLREKTSVTKNESGEE